MKNIKKILTSTIFLFCMYPLAYTPLLAQTVDSTTPTPESQQQQPLPTTTNEGKLPSSDFFKVSVVVGVQSAWTKNIPITIQITPNIDSERTEISWDLPPGFAVENKFDNFFPVQTGQTYTREASLTPGQTGTYDFAVNVTTWSYSTNYSSTERFVLSFDEDFIITPEQPGYQNNLIVKYSVIGVSLLIISVLAVLLGKILLKKLKAWLKPPQ